MAPVDTAAKLARDFLKKIRREDSISLFSSVFIFLGATIL
jgi:hypothetical protein